MKKIEYEIINISDGDAARIRFTYVSPELIDMGEIYYSEIHEIYIISDYSPEYNNMKLFIWGTHIDYNDETINVPLFVLTAIDEFNAQFEDSFYKSKEEIENERTMF